MNIQTHSGKLAAVNADSDTIPFEEAVRRGKALVADITKGDLAWMQLAELANNVAKIYGDRTLQKYAAEICIEYGTVKRCRTTYRQWVKIGAPAPRLYSAAQVLAKHPNAAAIARAKPDITKDEARKLMQEYKQQTDNKNKGADGNRKHHEGWQREVQNAATNAIRLAAIVDQQLTPENRRILRDVIEPSLAPHLVQGSEALAKLAAFLARLLAEEEGKEAEAPRFGKSRASQPRREAPRSQPRRAA